MDFKRPRKLNLNAPLLSTRRHGCSVVADTSCSSSSLGTMQNTSERVPFSWEKIPGKPKDMEKSDSTTQDADTKEVANETDVAFHDIDDGYCDGDDKKDDDDVFSDAMDVFSLSEALDIVQKKSENAHNSDNNNDCLRLKLAESHGYQSPTYMINRFLPDATALAASSSSSLNFHSDFEDKVCDTCSYYHDCYLKGSTSHSYSSSSPKGCGLEFLFPWRMKHKLCAMKNPVLPCSTSLQKHQLSSKQKKNRSSTYVPCTNLKEDI